MLSTLSQPLHFDRKPLAPPGLSLMPPVAGVVAQPLDPGPAPHPDELEALSAWISALPLERPGVCAEQLTRKVAEFHLLRASARRRFSVLEQLYSVAEDILARLDGALERSGLPMGAGARLVAAAQDRLLRELALAYGRLTDALCDTWSRLGFQHALQVSALRTAYLVHRRAVLACRVYAAPSPQRWSQLVHVHRIARRFGFARSVIEGELQDTIESLHIRTALLALADPASLAPEDVGRLRFYVERSAPHARITATRPRDGDHSGIFVLGSGKRGAQALHSEQPPAAGALLLDCRALLRRLHKQIEGLQAGTPPARLGLPVAASDAAYLLFLQRLHAQWSNPRHRQHVRASRRPHADLTCGFDAIRALLAHNEAVAGRRRTSVWAISDESSTGYGLQLLRGRPAGLQVGEVVAVRAHEAEFARVGVTRRALSHDHQRLDIGVELLSSQVVPAQVRKPHPGDGSHRVPALLLLQVPRLNNAPALLAPDGEIRPGMSLVVPHRGRSVQLEAAGTVERYASCELIRLKPRQLA